MILKNIWTISAFLLFICVGCGRSHDGPRRVSVEGKVTYHGKPVSHASVILTPDSKTNGPAAAGDVTDGVFHIPAEEGPVIGGYDAIVKILKPNSQHRGKVLPTADAPFDAKSMEFDTFTIHVTVREDNKVFNLDGPSDP